jgi:hypothetical protein
MTVGKISTSTIQFQRARSRVARASTLSSRLSNQDPIESYAISAVPAITHTPRRAYDQNVREQESRFYPARSFSAQLLELGLRYNVEGLVRKADTQIAATPTSYTKDNAAHQSYDDAQHNFSETRQHLVHWQA